MAQGRVVNPHAVLGLAPGATRTDLRRAFRARAQATHPDHGGDPDAFRAVRAAYEELRDRVPADTRAARVHGAYATSRDLDLTAFPAGRTSRRPPRRPSPAPAAAPARAGGFASLLQDALFRLATS
jgi:curved DNA-binding protein CbpA